MSRADRGEALAVCTLVRTQGSTPQKQGAMMLVLGSGSTLGTIGGGCVEAEVKTRAMQQMSAGASRLFTFQLNHDHGWDDGLVCGGVMDVALQIISTPVEAEPFRRAYVELSAGNTAELQTTLISDEGKRLTFTQPIEPKPTLVIAGAGHVGNALAAIVGLMDFSLLVIDDRPDFASSDRFPGAELRVGDIEAELTKLPLNKTSFVVIVTRGHRRDALALKAVIASKARYIGLIGSRRKVLKIFSDLYLEGISIEQLSQVYAPIGLDIHAVTPAEIAVSIAAQLIAVRQGSRSVQSMQLTRSLIERAVKAAGDIDSTPTDQQP